MNAKIINIRKLGEAATLAGADKGRGLFAKLILTVGAEPLFPSPLFLDFSGVEVATASYLRESVFEFRRAIRSRKSNYYPVIADANASVLEEVAKEGRSLNWLSPFRSCPTVMLKGVPVFRTRNGLMENPKGAE